jgi:hypothetical protein
MITPLMSKKISFFAFTCDLLILSFYILGEMGVFQSIDCLLISDGDFQFHKKFQMLCFIFVLVMNPTVQHNTVTLKQSSEAKQLIYKDKSHLFLFDKLQG